MNISDSMRGTIVERIQKTDSCWPWQGQIDKKGYGRYNGQLAHRLVYMILVGPIPDGLTLDHVAARGCTRKDCVNPDHLEPVTNKVNILRGGSFTARSARQTHCIRGHLFTPENTHVQHRRGVTVRVCRKCDVIRQAAYKVRRQKGSRP